MKIEKFKVLLYLKKSGLDKNGKAPIMGRITVNRTMAQFSCKLSCTPSLWNPRASRLEGPPPLETSHMSICAYIHVCYLDILHSRCVGSILTTYRNQTRYDHESCHEPCHNFSA